MASMSAPSPTMKSGKLGTRLEMSSSLCTRAADASSMVTLCGEMIQRQKLERHLHNVGLRYKTSGFFSFIWSNLKPQLLTNNEGHLCSEAGVYGFQMFLTSLMNMTGKTVWLILFVGLLWIQQISILGIHLSEWRRKWVQVEVANWNLRKRENFSDQQVDLGPLICTNNNSGGLQNGESDTVKWKCNGYQWRATIAVVRLQEVRGTRVTCHQINKYIKPQNHVIMLDYCTKI